MTHKEAIDRIKDMHSHMLFAEDREALETLVPELRESEDERIRKWLITQLQNNYKGNYWAIQAIEYLEKQKEQDWNKKPCLTCQEYEKGHKQGYTEGCTAGYNKAMKEIEQKEQLTNESFDSLFDDYCDAHPDGLTLEECGKFFFSKGKLVATNDFSLALAERYCQGLRDGQEEYWNPTEEDVTLFNKAITTNKSLTPDERAKLDIIRMKFKHRPVIKQKEQKPAEWSEKDKGILLSIKCVIDSVWHNFDYDCSKEELKEMWNWLDTLWQRVEYPQPMQEWSEEDEIRLKEALEVLDESIKYLPMGYGFLKDIMCVKDWLKSLRPQPKQGWSEEDEERCMELVSLLKDAEGYLKEHGNMFSYNPMLLRNWLKSLRPSWRPSEEQEPEYYQHFDPDC